MPTAFVNKIAKVCDLPISTVESKWKDSISTIKGKFPSVDEESSRFFALVTGLLKKSLGSECLSKLESSDDLITAEEMLTKLFEVKFKKVVRQGKIVRKAQCGKGFKFSGGRCKKIGSAEKIARSKGAKRGAKKIRAKSKQIARRRAKSNKRRANLR